MQFCHGVVPMRQPQEKTNPGGDCFACATFALLRHIFPNSPEITMATVFKLFTTTYANSEKETFMNYWQGYEKVFNRLRYKDHNIAGLDKKFPIDFHVHRPMPNYSHSFVGPAPWYGFPDTGAYWREADAWLRAGYILMAEVDIDGKGPSLERNGKLVHNHTNHVILIDGSRQFWPLPVEGEVGRGQQSELHVVDSNARYETNEYWMTVKDLLFKHGMAAFIAVRKSVGYDLKYTNHT